MLVIHFSFDSLTAATAFLIYLTPSNGAAPILQSLVRPIDVLYLETLVGGWGCGARQVHVSVS